MTPQELKNSILQLAIQGKLVEQRPEEGTAQELYAQIQAEKQRLIQSGKLKKEKPLPEITEDEKPFEIPGGWMWVRLGDIATLYNGRAYKQNELLPKGKYPVLRVGNLFTNGQWYYSDLELEDEKYCDDGDLLYSWSASFGPHIWQGNKVIYHYHIWKISHSSYINRNFFYYLLLADTESIKKSGHGLAMMHVTKASMEKRFLPLPPLAEQKRIVAKIEELLPLVDRYEQAWTKLEDFNRHFPEDMKKAIFQQAIQGKLVEQRPEEGTAQEIYAQIQAEKQRLIKEGKLKKEKSLPEITEDEKPFEIPEGWMWVRFGAVIDMLSGYAFKSQDFKKEGRYRLLRGINLGVNTIRWDDTVYLNEIPNKLSAYKLSIGDLLLGLDRPWISEGIRVGIFNDPQDTFLVQRVLRIREIGAITNKYAALILRSALFMTSVASQTTGISVPHISPSQVSNMAIPLPPLAEQNRIVARLEELLPLCERLKKEDGAKWE